MRDTNYEALLTQLIAAQTNQPELYLGMTSGQWITTIIQTVILAVTVYVMWKGRNGAVEAVRIGRQLSQEAAEVGAKKGLFSELYANRGRDVNYNAVDALNRIDVVFHNAPKVLAAWQELKKALNEPGKNDRWKDMSPEEQNRLIEEWNNLRRELLIQMAAAVGYDLPQKDLATPAYSPRAHGDEQDLNKLLRYAAIDFFETGDVSNRLLPDYFDFLKAAALQQIQASQKQPPTEQPQPPAGEA